jgi:hypothetical protein
MASGEDYAREGRVTAARKPLMKATVQYGYFVLQARATRNPDGIEITGILENLGTGEKRSFEGCDALARLLDAWGSRTVAGS